MRVYLHISCKEMKTVQFPDFIMPLYHANGKVLPSDAKVKNFLPKRIVWTLIKFSVWSQINYGISEKIRFSCQLKTRKFHIVGQLTAWGASWNFKSL
jgi:hypothetical protein